mmetsp:Transcript_28216/g.38156  ORF Transcript_28216/g.38156 Transcript_28216/m.38156 type:complete len:369 (+) Transcript_28216:229-1335(+)
MAKSHSTTTLVQFILGNTEDIDTVESLGSKSFVNLEGVNITQLETGSLESSGDGVSGTNTHDSGRNTSDGEANDSTEDLGTEFLGNVASCEEHAGCTISDLGRVTSSGHTILSKSRLKLLKTLEGSVGTDTIISINHNILHFTVLVLDLSLVRGDFFLGPSVLLCTGSLHVRLNSHFVHLFSSDLEILGNVFRGDTHRHEAVTSLLVFKDALIKKVRVNGTHHIVVGHGFDTTTNTNANLATLDRVSNSSNSLKTRGAQSVGSMEASSIGEASQVHSHTGVGGSGTWSENITNDNILNLIVLDTRLLNNFGEDRGEHGLDTSVSLSTLLGSGHGSTGHTNDNNIVVSLGANLTTVVVSLVLELGVKVF